MFSNFKTGHFIEKISVTILVVCFGSYSCTSLKHHREPSQHLSDIPNGQREGKYEKRGIHFTKSDVYRLKKVLPLLPLGQLKHLRNIYDIARISDGGDGVYLDIDQMLYADLDEYLIQLSKDEQLQAILQDTRSVGESYVAPSDENVDISEIPKKVSDRNQTQGWEGCVRDYDMVMLPETQAYKKLIVLKLNDLLGLPIFPVPDVPPANPVASPLVDSNGKRPAGFWQGALHWVGAVDLCHVTGVRYTWNVSGTAEQRAFRGKYVRLDIPWILSNPNISTLWPFAIGVCAPDTCDDADIARYASQENDVMLSYLLGGGIIPRNVTYVYSGQNPNFSTDAPAKGIAAVGAILGILLLVSTCYDGWGRHRIIREKIRKEIKLKTNVDLTLRHIKRAENYLYDSPSLKDRLETCFTGFSLYSNISRVYQNRFPREFHVPCIDGLRALTFLWLTKAMSRMYGILYFEAWTSHNVITALRTYYDEWTDMSLISLPLNSSAFFYLSGFVCVQTFYKAYHANEERISFWLVFRYFAHRFWSIMPTVTILMMIYMWFYRYLIDGPLMSSDISDAEKCDNTWYLPFLLWHNLFKLENQCFAFTWYYGVVWQLNIFSIVVLLPLVFLPALGYLMAALMFVAHIIVFGIWQKRRFDGELTWFFDIQMTPWCQAGPYVIGMVVAMILRGSDRRKRWHWFPILLMWVFSLTALLAAVYAPWDQLKAEDRQWTKRGEVAFGVLAPQMFALALGWITFACWKGYGGVVAKLLNWKVFSFMSRLMLPMTVFMGPVMQRYHLHRHSIFYIHENHVSMVYFANIIGLFTFGNVIAFLFTYPASRGIAAAIDAKTRLELFVYGRHPDILSGFSGDPKQDSAHMQRLILKTRREKQLNEKVSLENGDSKRTGLEKTENPSHHVGFKDSSRFRIKSDLREYKA